ncbi:flap endonuclease [Alkalilimnicola ehrlichii]|uniref:Flap endonuclease n=2 Tax=Alkalilimnicola ehrlichii TaxID=351052 RepID=A0A3E0X1W3_9GAMM|nr:5'-3' exonuclease H3TH domain-containing protein [Alkalilimnicola ehrlichii]RFA31110.1 flap endonuclease [Alkalilimnicola ehrlichii]RFA39653.1 flap endonuclease [Alkalilimnicola ehrlichii]
MVGDISSTNSYSNGGLDPLLPRLYLIDASVYVFRAYYSVDPAVQDAYGEPANAVFGYGMFLCELLERRRPQFVVAAFDESLTTSFRNALYPAYKANRPPAPPDLKRQFRLCRELTVALGIRTFASRRYEADDLIGSLAERCAPQGPRVFVTSDKDYAQLLQGEDRLWDVARNRWLDAAGVADTFGIRPEQVADFLGLAGDSVDNVPGVPGIGAKTAAALLAQWPSLEAVYEALDTVPTLPIRGAARVRRLLVEHREQAFLSRRLATIERYVPLCCDREDLVWRGGDRYILDDLPLPERLRQRFRRVLAEAL